MWRSEVNRSIRDYFPVNQIASSRGSSILNYTNKEYLIQDHERSIQEMSREIGPDEFHINSTVTPVLPRSVTVLLNAETRVTIADLVQAGGNPIFGKYFLCRTIVPPFKIVELSTVVEDPTCIDAVRLALYNFLPESNPAMSLSQLQQHLPVGTILAIKNPWFKPTADRGFSVRSDNPGDVSVLDQSFLDHTFPGLEWNGVVQAKYVSRATASSAGQNAGAIDPICQENIQFTNKNYESAVLEYTKAINEMTSKDRVELFSNRAAAYLKLEKFESALSDCEDALLLDSKILKAKYRKVKALWGLGKYEEAHQFTISAIKPALKARKLSSDTREEIAALVKTAKRNLRQSKFGEYDLISVLEATERKEQIGKLDWAEFTGKIEVQSAGSKGRGIFATKELQPGELIMASRAFASVLDERKEPSFELRFQTNMNMEDGKIYDIAHDQLVAQIAKKLVNNPEKASEFYTLFAGPELGDFEIGPDQACSSTNIDMTRIRKISDYNSFSHHIRDDQSQFLGMPFALGLWILPSFLNHSCVDNNAHWTIYGDFLLVRANKRILSGEEILIPYQCPSKPSEERRKYISSFHHFKCQCRLCVLEAEESEETQSNIQEMLSEFKDYSIRDYGPRNYPAGFEKKIKNCIKTLRTARPNSGLLNPALLKPLDILSKFYFQSMQLKKCRIILEELYLIETNLNMTRTGVGHVTNILACVLMTEPHNKVLVKSWIRKWKEAAVQVFGTANVLPVVGSATLGLATDFRYDVLP